MKNKKNKKGAILLFAWLAISLLIAIPIFAFLGGGGASASWKVGSVTGDIINALSKIPSWGWILLGIFCLLRILGGGRRRR